MDVKYLHVFVQILAVMCCVSSCTVEVPDYVSAETGESSHWINIYGDTTEDISVYATYSQGHVYASLGLYSAPDSIGFIEDINVSIPQFNDQDSGLTFTYGEFPGSLKQYTHGTNYARVRDTILADCDSLKFDMLSFSAQRTYSVSEENLPDTIEVWYEVKTSKGNASGKIQLKKTVREYEEAMRLH